VNYGLFITHENWKPGFLNFHLGPLAMKSRGLLIAALVLAALSGVMYWSNRHPASEDSSSKAASDASVKILSLNQADIVRFSIRRKDQLQVDFSKNPSGSWEITAPKPLAADQDDVSSLLSGLSSLSSDRLIEQKVDNTASYGLTNPPLEIVATLKDNKTQKLLVGDQTPSGNAFYAMQAGDPRLFTIASYAKTSLDKSVNDLRDKRLLTADFDRVSQIELRNAAKKQEVTLARSKDSWQIVKPAPYRADSDSVDGLIRALREAKMDLSAASDNADTGAAFKSAQPFGDAKITGASGTQELEVRKTKDKDDYYAKSSAISGVYKVAATTGTGLNKDLDDFRNKKLFDFGYQDPEKIEIHDGARSYLIKRSGSDWWGPDGKKLDTSTVDPVVEKIRGLAATRFPASGFTTPAVQLTVTSNDGKRVERISLCKSGDTYFAKRENEPALYELSSSSVQELLESAAKVKPNSEARSK